MNAMPDNATPVATQTSVPQYTPIPATSQPDSSGFDWIAVQLQTGGGKSPSDLTSMGVDPDNTTLSTPDFYKSTSKIQKLFTGQDGKFDNNAFNSYYQKAVQSYNNYIQSAPSVTNAATNIVSDDSMTRYLGMNIRRQPVQVSLVSKDPFTNLKTAQGSFYGLTEFNKWSDPKLSIQQVATTQNVVDPTTGKQLNYKPEDTGLFNLYGFLSEPLVLAQYDSDIRDDKGKIIHKQGEDKLNAQGLPFYETLSGRDPSGKQVLSRQDTLTKEGSFYSQFDFMKSNQIQKGAVSSIIKAAVQYLPMLIPGVGEAYSAYVIAQGLVDSGASIAKAVDGIINGDSAKQDSLYKWANTLQGYTGQLKGGVSQYGKDTWYSPENLLNQAVDALYILKSQNNLVKWPQEFTKWKMAKELGVATDGMLSVGDAATNALGLGSDVDLSAYVAKYGGNPEGVMKSIQALQQNQNLFVKYSTYAQHFSTAYMAASTAASISNLADQRGIDERDKGFLYLGYTAALIPFFSSGFGRWVNKAMGGSIEEANEAAKPALENARDTINEGWSSLSPDDAAKVADNALQTQAPALDDITTKTSKVLGQSTIKEKAMFNLAVGKQLGDKVVKYLKGLNTNEFKGAIIANAVDMTSQKAISDGLQVVYNGLSSAGLTSSQENKQFDINPISFAKDLISEGFSGAIGGAMFHLAGIATGSHPAPTYSANKVIDYVNAGHIQELYAAHADMLKKGQFGSTKLSMTPMTDENGDVIPGVFKPVSKENPLSQNQAIGEKVLAGIKMLESLKSAYNMQDPDKTAAAKNDFYNGIIDTKTDTDLYLQLNHAMKNVFKLGTDIRSYDKLDKNGDDESLINKKAELSLALKQLKHLQGNDSIDEFFTQGLFNIRMDINEPFGVDNRETIAQREAGRPYKQLNSVQQTKVDDMYKKYVLDPDTGLMPSLQKAYQEYKHFDEKMESKGYYREIQTFRESVEHLKKYVMKMPLPYFNQEPTIGLAKVGTEEQGKQHIESLLTNEQGFLEDSETHALTQDYMSKLAGVKYVPDYIYDHVKKAISLTASHEANGKLGELANGPGIPEGLTEPQLLERFNKLNQFRITVNGALNKDLSNELIKEYVNKLVGDKNFKEFTETPEFKDLQTNKSPESNYSTLKVLKDLAFHAQNIDPTKLNEQRQIAYQLDKLDEPKPTGEFDNGPVINTFEQYADGNIDKNNPIISEFSRIDGLIDYINTSIQKGLPYEMWERYLSTEGLQRFININHLQKTIGRDLTEGERDNLFTTFNTNNIYTRLLTEGKYNLGNSDLNLHTINSIDDTNLRSAIDTVRNFNQTRIPSPLRGDNDHPESSKSILRDVYKTLNSEIENLDTVGTSNYLNADDSFTELLDTQINAIKRIGALLNAANTSNPIINDFRANHRGLLSDDLRDKVLTILDNDDLGTLGNELNRVYRQVNYLKDLNEFNKNNTIARLLREDGFELSAKVQSLNDLAQDPDILKLIPSLGALQADQDINNFVSSYKSASDDSKLTALSKFAKIEENIYQDVQNLTDDDKKVLVNKSFRPINSSAKDFYDNISGDEPLNDSHRTIYLATIFGSSTINFYANYAGKYDSDAEAFTNLNKTPYIPFAKQESAVRVANLVINGDPTIIRMFLNAYSYDGSTDIVSDFSSPKDGNTSFDSSNLVAILGSSGTGKTTAVLYSIMNMIPDEDSNVMLLTPKNRQFNTLRGTLINGGYEKRLDDRSSTVREFINNLNLKYKDGSKYDVTKNDEILNGVDIDKKETGNAKIDFYTKFDTQVFDKLDLYDNKKLKPEIANLFSKTRLFATDEFTHLNPIDLCLITNLINDYNKTDIVLQDPSKRSSIVVLGDANQMGFLKDDGTRRDYTNVATTIISQPLLTSLRSGWDLINNTLVDLQRRTMEVKEISGVDPAALTTSEIIQKYRDQHLQLFNYQGVDGNIGMKSIKVDGNLKASDLSFITDNKSKTFKDKDGNDIPVKGKDIVYIINSDIDIPRAQALLREALGANWEGLADIEIYKPEEVQGGEYKYTIIDAKPRLTPNDPKSNDYDYSLVRVHEFLNTMLSRATEATLLIEDPSITNYIGLDNVAKGKATNQKKITDQVIAQVKKNKQIVLAAILGEDYVPQGAKPGSKIDTSAVPPPKPIADLYSNSFPIELTQDPLNPKSPAAKINTGIDLENKINKAKVKDIVAYTTYSTKADFDLISSIPSVADDIDTLKTEDMKKSHIENIIQSLKYYIVKGPIISENNVALKANFEQYLKQYDYNSPIFYIEAAKKEGTNVQYGRSEDYWQDPKPDQFLFSLRVKLPSKTGEQPLDITLGLLNSFTNLENKFKAAQNNESKVPLTKDDTDVNTFIKHVRTWLISGDRNSSKQGVWEEGKWRSRDLSAREWRSISETWDGRYNVNDPKTPPVYPTLKDLKAKYPDYHISEPQVIVSLFKDENGKLIVDDAGDPIQDFRGKSVVFMSEYKELQKVKNDDLLNIYLKQLKLFGTKDFLSLDKDGKEAYIKSKPDRIQVDGQFTLPYKPNMVQMIRLDTPRDSFLGFRQKFLAAIHDQESGGNVFDLFEKFDMSPYVKDRLAKSLLTIKQFIESTPDNKQWFKEEVLDEVNKTLDTKIEELRTHVLNTYGETGDAFQDNDSFKTLMLDPLKPFKRGVDEFSEYLNDLLDLNDPHTIFRRKFDTDINKINSAHVPDKKNSNPVQASDLQITLTPDKRVDFNQSILDLNLLNLFNKTKNLNFAAAIDKALIEFTKFPQGETRFDNYRLDKVLKDGQLENLVIASRAALKGYQISNMLADVKSTGHEFIVPFRGIQQAAYNIDFAKLLSLHDSENLPITESEVSALHINTNQRLQLFDELGDKWLTSKFGDFNNDLRKLTNTNDQYNFLQGINDKIDSLNEIERVVPSNEILSPGTKTTYQVSPNGIVAIDTVESEVKRGLIEQQDEFSKLTHDQITLENVSFNKNKAVFKAKVGDSEFKVTYDAKTGNIDPQRLDTETWQEKLQRFFPDLKTSAEINQATTDILSKVVKDTSEQVNPSKLLTIDSMKDELGHRLYNLLTPEQTQVLLPDTKTTDKDYYSNLMDSYVDNFVKDGKNWYTKVSDMAKTVMDNNRDSALGLDTEEPDPIEAEVKEESKVDKLNLLKKDVNSADNKAIEEFKLEAGKLFNNIPKEQQTTLRDWIKNYQLRHRLAIANKIVTGREFSLEQLDLKKDFTKFTDKQLSDEFQDKIEQDPDLYEQYRVAFNKLTKYRVEKSSNNC